MGVSRVENLLELDVKVDEVLLDTFKDWQCLVHHMKLFVGLHPFKVIEPFAGTAETGKACIARGTAFSKYITLQNPHPTGRVYGLVMKRCTHADNARAYDGQVSRSEQMFTFPVSYGHTFA